MTWKPEKNFTNFSTSKLLIFFPPAPGKRLTLEIIAQQAFLPGLVVRANHVKENKTKQNKTHNSQISFDLMDRVYSLGKTNRKSTLSQ